jgi:NAD(P)-dependent dehydrogenase (short-subunit alcohol dehydrogenase family)
MNGGDFLLTGGAVLVTGAGSGIGAAIARAAVAAGAAVAVNDLDADRAEAVCREIREGGGVAHCVPGDVSAPASAAAVVERAIAALGALTGLANNVGVVGGGALRSIALEDWERVLRVDLMSALYCARAAYDALEASGGAVVNTSSLVALHPAPGAGAYNVAKAALVSLTQQLALEWGPAGIRVNAIAPGIISGTNFSPRGNLPAVLARRAAIVPLRRTGRAEDVAPAVVFLLSPAARYITGHLLVIDGGLGLSLQTHLPG